MKVPMLIMKENKTRATAVAKQSLKKRNPKYNSLESVWTKPRSTILNAVDTRRLSIK